MDVSLFDFDLPQDRIALRPVSPRDAARLLVVHKDGNLEHRHVRDLPDYLTAKDALIINDTRVIAARLRGQRLRPGGPAGIEVLLHRRLAPNRFSALARPARKLTLGDTLVFGTLAAKVGARGDGGEVEISFGRSGTALDEAIAAEGETPLPPYIAGKRPADAQDAEDYQTVFADAPGSVAAPTAGLHFTAELLARLAKKGVRREELTLHIGLGTFQPVTALDTTGHRMHSEWAHLPTDVAARLNRLRAAGGCLVACGTTVLRALESAVDATGHIRPMEREINIFITPGFHFHAVDVLLTNFHLPRSTLFMLVSAFMGLDVMRHAYREAIAKDYRFYSYGDACLLIRPS
jgi:S-adenosylmethionine:tRNA ribosyltransferase-isomerase